MRILLTGGAACGKSSFAEGLAVKLPGPRYYVATMRPYDEECLKKIDRHQRMRADKGFETLERPVDLGGLCPPRRGTVLLECLCNLTANEMFDETGCCREVGEKLLKDVERLSQRCEHLIVVTNEVGADGGAYDAGTMAYIRTLGQLNRALARRFDCVCELVCGIPLVRKGALP